MLNKAGERELAYVVTIDEIKEIPNYDRVEHARVGGWWVIVRKDQFKVGDPAIYIEVDSKVPEKEPFMFLEQRYFKVKTLKMCKVISQGLLMSAEDFGWEIINEPLYGLVIADSNHKGHYVDDESRFLTKELGIIYAEAADNKRKANSADKYKLMAQRHGKLFSKQPFRWLMKRTWGKKLLFVFFGKKKDKKNGLKAFPTHLQYISKSDEERVENIPFILEDKDIWIKTTKIDGTSSLYLLERKKKNKFEYWVCSRNIRQLSKDQECFHQDNVYWEVNDKYKIEECLKDLLEKHPEWDYVAIQGESAGCSSSGAKIQGDPNNFKELRFFAYNFITSDIGRWNSIKGKEELEKYNIPWVPIVNAEYILPDNMEDFKLSADGECEAEGAAGIREGFVYRRADAKQGQINSFKNVSRNYLLKHNN